MAWYGYYDGFGCFKKVVVWVKDFRLYKIPIAYLLLYLVAILATGVWLFLLSQGLQSSVSLGALLLDVAQAPEVKSLHNFIEVATPHMFAMGTLIFVVAHFMLFSTKVSQKRTLWASLLLYGAMFVNIFSYLLIIFGVVILGWVKLIALGVFVILFLLLLGMVAFSL